MMNKYYVSKDAIQKSDIAMEFEVWARIIKDSEGNDIQAFIKEDKRNGLRKDSSFYYDGSWEVFEFDDVARETRFRTSSGIRSLRKYDDKKRLKEYYKTNKGDTLESQQYEWKNGRLVRVTANGVVRSYIYGKTLKDTVRVVPSDEGFNYHRGYNGTAGKIPEEGTPDYEIFARNPYGHVAFGEEEEKDEYEESSPFYFAAKNSAPENTGPLNVLSKTPPYDCVTREPNMSADIPRAQCIRYERKDIPKAADKNFGFPSENKRLIYGKSDAKYSLTYGCKCDASGKYQPSFKGKAIDKKIEVYQSIWRYLDYGRLDWHELCFKKDSWQKTYNHEIKHIENAIYMADSIVRVAKKDSFSTKKECESVGKNEYYRLMEKWDEWYDREQRHINLTKPESPMQSSEIYDEYPCY